MERGRFSTTCRRFLKSESVWIVEGEKDVGTLKRMHLVGTTSPGGAGKWKKAFNHHLKGKNIVVLPDNDEPGRNHAGQVAASLQSVAKSIKVLELPNLPDHGDLSDWVKGRLPSEAAGDLSRLADQATEWKSPRPADCTQPELASAQRVSWGRS